MRAAPPRHVLLVVVHVWRRQQQYILLVSMYIYLYTDIERENQQKHALITRLGPVCIIRPRLSLYPQSNKLLSRGFCTSICYIYNKLEYSYTYILYPSRVCNVKTQCRRKYRRSIRERGCWRRKGPLGVHLVLSIPQGARHSPPGDYYTLASSRLQRSDFPWTLLYTRSTIRCRPFTKLSFILYTSRKILPST